MKTLKFALGIIGLAGLTFISANRLSYSLFKKDLENIGKKNPKYAEIVCKEKLANYNKGKFIKIIDGSDEAAREYLIYSAR